MRYRLRRWLCNNPCEGCYCEPRWWQLRLRYLIWRELKPVEWSTLRPVDLHGQPRCPHCFRSLRRLVSYDGMACPAIDCKYGIAGRDFMLMRGPRRHS